MVILKSFPLSYWMESFIQSGSFLLFSKMNPAKFTIQLQKIITIEKYLI